MCHPEPSRVYAWWAEPPFLAVVPVGHHFDVLRLRQALGLTVLWELGREAERLPVLEEHGPPPGCISSASPVPLESGPAWKVRSCCPLAASWRCRRRWPTELRGCIVTVFCGETRRTAVGALLPVLCCVRRLSVRWTAARQADRVRAARTSFFGARHRRGPGPGR